MLKAYKTIKHKLEKDLENSLVDQLFKAKDNKTYLYKNLNSKNSKNKNSKNENNKDGNSKKN